MLNELFVGLLHNQFREKVLPDPVSQAAPGTGQTQGAPSTHVSPGSDPQRARCVLGFVGTPRASSGCEPHVWVRHQGRKGSNWCSRFLKLLQALLGGEKVVLSLWRSLGSPGVVPPGQALCCCGEGGEEVATVL